MVNLQGTALRQERMTSYSPTYSKRNNAFAKMLETEEETKKTTATKRRDSLERVGSSVSEDVKEAWEKAEKDAGMNGMAIDSSGRYTGLTELNVMSLLDIRKGGSGEVLGNTKQSAMEAVQKALGRLGIPENENERKEKMFYEAFLRYLAPEKSEKFVKNVVSKEDVKNQLARQVIEGIRPMSQKELENISDRDENTIHAMNLLAELEARNESIYQTLLSIKEGTWQSWKQNDVEVRTILEKE